MENTKQSQSKKKTQQSIIYCYSLHYYNKKLPLFFLYYLHYSCFIHTAQDRLLKTFTFKIITISILLCRIQTYKQKKIRIFISFHFPYYSKSGRYFSHLLLLLTHFYRSTDTTKYYYYKTTRNDGIVPKTPKLSLYNVVLFPFLVII